MSWIKKLFSKNQKEPEELKTYSVAVRELPDWFDSQVHKKFESLRSEVSEAYDAMEEQLPLISKGLDALNVAQLRNDKIPEKEKHIMEGNRSSYIKLYRQFIESLKIPDDISYYNTTAFCDEFTKTVETLVQSCSKNVLVLKEFFANEVAVINKSMKILSDSIEHIKQRLSAEKQDLVFIEGLKDDISSIKGKMIREKELKDELAFVNEKLSLSTELKSKIEKQGHKLKNSPAYSELEKLKQTRDDLRVDERNVSKDISHLFAQIDKSLKRYQRIAMDNSDLILKYVEDSVGALAEDETFSILSSLESMVANIDSAQLGLKDKEKDKLKQRVNSITRELLETLRNRLLETRKSKRKVEHQCNSSGVMRELDDVTYKIQHTSDQIASLKNKIDLANKNLDKLSIGESKTRLQEQLGFFMKGKVSIVFSKNNKPTEKTTGVTSHTKDNHGVSA